MLHRERDIVCRLMILGMMLRPATLLAMSEPYIKGSLSTGGVEDDNLFSTAQGKESDFIYRLTPEMEAGIRSEPLTLLGRYSFDAERFTDHPELDNVRMRARALFDLKTSPERAWSLAFDGAFTRTETPGELNLATGVLAGRAAAERVELDSSFTRRLGASASVTPKLAYVRDELSGGASVESRIGSLAFEREVTGRDRLSAGFEARRFDFDTGQEALARSFTLGWSRQATARTDFTLRAGPRAVEGSVKPEASASIAHRLKKGSLSCAYTNSLTTIIGQTGIATFESLAVAADLRPFRSLSLYAAPSAVRVKSGQGGSEIRVYLGTIGATWRFSPWVALAGTYQFTLERAAPGRASEDITRDIVLLRLVVSTPGPGEKASAR